MALFTVCVTSVHVQLGKTKAFQYFSAQGPTEWRETLLYCCSCLSRPFLSGVLSSPILWSTLLFSKITAPPLHVRLTFAQQVLTHIHPSSSFIIAPHLPYVISTISFSVQPFFFLCSQLTLKRVNQISYRYIKILGLRGPVKMQNCKNDQQGRSYWTDVETEILRVDYRIREQLPFTFIYISFVFAVKRVGFPSDRQSIFGILSLSPSGGRFLHLPTIHFVCLSKDLPD